MVFQYTVEAIDVDGDGIPDGDLVTKWRLKKDGTRTVVQHKFVPSEKIKTIVQQAATATATAAATDAATPKLKTKSAKAKPAILKTYKGAVAPAAQEQQILQVQDRTKFGQYIKMGAGLEVGRIAIDSVASAISDLF